MLDTEAPFHVTSSREWFGTYASGTLGHVRLADGSTFAIVGAGDVTLSLPSGASLVVRHVHHVPDLPQSLISVRQLRDTGCHVVLDMHSFRLHRGQLVIARGASVGTIRMMQVRYVLDSIVAVSVLRCKESRRVNFGDARLDQSSQVEVTDTTLKCRQREMRQPSFARELQYAPELEHMVVQDMSTVIEVEQQCSSETQQDLSESVWDISVRDIEQVCFSETQTAMTDMEFFGMLMLDVDEDLSGHRFPPMGDRVKDTPVSEMTHPCMMSSPNDAVYANNAEAARIAMIAQVSSAFGHLMYDLLVSRPDLAAVLGAFTAGIVSRTMADMSMYRGDL